MKTARLLVAATAAFASLAVAAGVWNMDADWRFAWAKDTIPLANALRSMEQGGVKATDLAYDDSDWELVSIPHPVNAHDTFDNHAVDPGEAAFRRGLMLYRKHFTLPPGGEKHFLTFETVRQSIYLWVNGKFAGYYEAGVAPTAYDVSALVKPGDNLVTVATDNCAMRGTKVFTHETIPGHEPGDMSGSAYQWNSTDFNEVQGGLVGNVQLVAKPSKVYLTLPYYNNLKTRGTYVTAGGFDFKSGTATIRVKAQVRNESGKDATVVAKVKVADAATGKTVATFASAPGNVPAAKDAGRIFQTALEADVYEPSPAPTGLHEPDNTILEASGQAAGLVFWSPETPHLYDVTVTLVSGGKILDTETIRTGFRQVTYDAAEGGLKINGKNVWLPGYAQRATDEWAAIGVPPDWLQDLDAALIRRSNANFVRWMHVAPKPAPVRSYDKFGVVNAAPAGDKEGDTSGRAWAQRMEAMRDVIIFFRNSPSVVFWEAGNNAISAPHMKEMTALKRLLDPDGWRFMGCRTINSPEAVAEAEYVGTMLHRHETPAFDSMKKLGRFMPMMETEYARQESPRRSWDDFTPPDYDYRGRYLNGGKKEAGFDVYDQTQEDFALSTAAEYAGFYGARASGNAAKTYSACAALCWTDSNQHGRNSFSENCRSSGRVDAVRLPKVNFNVFRVMQSEDPAVMVVGHWSYPKFGPGTYWYPVKEFNGKFMAETGKTAQRDPLHKTVYAIGSVHCASVELLVNGKSKGVVAKPQDVFVYAFPGIDVTESGKVEAVARDAAGNVIARDEIKTFAGPGTIKTRVLKGPAGFVADGSDIAVVDFKLVDAAGTVHPYASDKIEFALEGDAKFMGGWNSGTFDETSPVGKDWVNLECGIARVFVKAGRKAGKIALKWRCANGQSGTVNLETVPATVKGGLMDAPPATFAPNARTFARKTDAPAVQDLAAGAAGAVKYDVFVNGAKVAFNPKGFGAPVKLDGNTGVVCEFAPVLAALKAAGAEVDYSVSKKINQKWLRKLAPSPYTPVLTVKAGGRTIDAVVGFTELFLDDGKDKNLTNCEVFDARSKHGIVCGELPALVGYIPGVVIKVDDKTRRLDLEVK